MSKSDDWFNNEVWGSSERIRMHPDTLELKVNPAIVNCLNDSWKTISDGANYHIAMEVLEEEK